MRRALVLIVVMLVISMAHLHGQIPHTVSYQGVLTDANGNAVPDGNVALTFRLFDVVSGGTALWEETQQVAVSKGVFNAILGSATPLNLPFDKPYWVGITVAQGTELTPRVALTASPYSLNSHSTIAEPAPGQGLTIRDTQGNPTHILSPGGELFHKGKATFDASSLSEGDTALVILSKGAGIVIIDTDTGSTGAPRSDAFKVSTPPESPGNKALRRVQQEESVVRAFSNSRVTINSESLSGVGVWGHSNSGRGVVGSSTSSQGVEGTSETATGVSGVSNSSLGVSGQSTSSHGVQGTSVTGAGVLGTSLTGAGVFGRGNPAGFFDGEVRIISVNQDPTQERFLVWSTDQIVRYRTLPPSGAFDGILQGKAFVVKSATGTEVFRVDTNGTSLHKGDETFEGDVIFKGQTGKGAKLVDANGITLAGFGRLDSSTGKRMGVYGKAEHSGDLAGVFDGDVEIDGEITVSSLHVVNGSGQDVFTVNSDGSSEHGGLETFKQGLQTTLSNGNILRISPAEGLTLKTAAGAFRGHMDPNGNGFFAGTLTKGGGSFKIDHPLDPENKYLYHSFVESPDMKNVYDGVITLDENGEATVTMPEWFEALNRDFRYQLTSIGVYSPLYIAEEITENHFRISGGKPDQKASWQVTGIRKDAYAEKHRIPVEESKPAADRGRYLHPEAFGLPKDMGVSIVPGLQQYSQDNTEIRSED